MGGGEGGCGVERGHSFRVHGSSQNLKPDLTVSHFGSADGSDTGLLLLL